MHAVLSVLAGAMGFAILLWALLGSTRSALGPRAQKVLGVAMIVAGVGLLLSRVFALAIPFLIFGVSLVLPRGVASVRVAEPRTSQVRSACSFVCR